MRYTVTPKMPLQISTCKHTSISISVTRLFPSSSDGPGQIPFGDLFPAGEIPRGALGVDCRLVNLWGSDGPPHTCQCNLWFCVYMHTCGVDAGSEFCLNNPVSRTMVFVNWAEIEVTTARMNGHVKSPVSFQLVLYSSKPSGYSRLPLSKANALSIIGCPCRSGISSLARSTCTENLKKRKSCNEVRTRQIQKTTFPA